VLGQRSLWLHRILRHEFSAEQSLLKSDDLLLVGDASVGSGLETDVKPVTEALLRAALYSGPGLCVWTTLRSTLNAPGRHKTATRQWEDRARASFDQGGITYRRGAFSLFLGRDELSWGAERQAGLLLSGSAPNMDMLRVTLESSRFLFTSFHSQLRRGDDEEWDESMRRFLAGHRVEILFSPTLSASISEVVVYGGENRSLEAGYLNPFTVFYAEQWNSGHQDNILIAGDVSWVVPGRAELRGEVMIDDFQYDFSTEPHELAAGVAVTIVNPALAEGSMLGASYFHVRNRTYGHFVGWNRYVHEESVIGYPAGPDGDNLRLWISLASPEALLWNLDYVHRRKGEGRATDVLERVGTKESFPSGTVERLHQVGLDLSWRPLHQWIFNGRIEYHHLTNRDNTEGSDDDGITIRVNATYNLKWSSKL
jgi:hypothetical protein